MMNDLIIHEFRFMRGDNLVVAATHWIPNMNIERRFITVLIACIDRKPEEPRNP
jgi:hypothetical protein